MYQQFYSNHQEAKAARRSHTKAGTIFYIYLLQSIFQPQEHYTGFTEDLKARFKEHNSGKSVHTNKFRPWKLVAYFAFNNIQAAKDFEAYLKTGSGRSFLKRHFLNKN
jgi:predicted GIY-YIG superfamily endonuclease